MDLRALMNRGKNRFRYWMVRSRMIKRLIPSGIRHRVSNRIVDALAPETKVPVPYEKGLYPKGINLYGFFKAENGLAQGVKMYARALEDGKIPHRLLNTDCLDWLRQEDTGFDDRLSAENEYAVNVIHINPDQWQEATGMFPANHFNKHYNIGVWLWELEQVPERWKPLTAYVDEIWAPSAFIADAMRKATDKPVTVIPYGIETPYEEGLTRADFGLAEEDFLVLMMYDSNSYASRKNPGAAIEAFREAYGEKPEGVKLVIKISNPKEEDIAFVRSRLDPGSYMLMTERMERKRLNSLIKLCDVFISLHRAEGFGLVMAEAMSLGTPVVATAWSASGEFMAEGTACRIDSRPVPVGDAYQGSPEGTVWAEADVKQAAGYLKRLREDEEFRKALAEAGKRQIQECLSITRCAERIARRLDEIVG